MHTNRSRLLLAAIAALLATLSCDFPFPTAEPGDTPTVYEPGDDTPGPGEQAPTPTEQPSPTPEPALLLVYTKGGNLWVSEDGGAPVQLTSGGADSDPVISPDGGEVLFRRELPPSLAGLYRFELRVINVDGSGERSVLGPADLPGEMGIPMESESPVLLDQLPFQVEWLRHAHALAFNTRVEAGYGLQHKDDLWVIDLDADTVTELLPHPQGGMFAYSPDGSRIVVTTAYTVTMVNSDGANRRELVTFPFVNTASEYALRPVPVWAPDSSYARVAVPSAEPFGPGATATLWQLPLAGSAVSLATLSGEFLFPARDGRLWSPDRARIAYAVPTAPDPSIRELTIAQGDGASPVVYATARLGLETWVPNTSRFIFWQNDPGEDYLGQLGEAATRLVPPGVADRVFELAFADESSFAFTAGAVNNWTVYLGQIGGPFNPIDTCPDPFVDLGLSR
jgi:hypothetical protein